MKKLLLFVFFLFSLGTFAQEDAWVYFNQKPNSEMFLANPLQMLSQRALDRRAMQSIPLDEKDVPISQDFIDQVEDLEGITVMAKSKWMNAVHVRGSVEAIQSATNLSFVDHIYLANTFLNGNLAGRIANVKKVTNENKSLDAQIVYNYGNSNNQIEMINGHLLHQQDFTGSGKIIAILDAGFPSVNSTQPFQRLFDNNQILGGYNFVSRNENIYSANNHGTLVLSTIGGFADGQLIGTAPDASYYLFITEDTSSENPVEESLWVEAAETADSLGVDIINTSLGYFGYQNPDYSYTYADMNGSTSFIARGADIAFSRGMIVVVSAGNSGNSSNPNISTPADAFNVLTVGAVDSNEVYAPFSSIGTSSDGRVKPDVMAKGASATVANEFGTIGVASGTSFSAPIMTGMVACLWQALPQKTNAEIIQLIKESANLYSNPNVQFGYGIPDFAQALETALGIESVANETFKIYPNPAKSNIFIQLPKDSASGKITFYNALGQLVFVKNTTVNESISVENWTSGLYFYKITFGNTVRSGKIIKN